MTPILGTIASSISGHLETTAYESISTVTLISSSASVSLSSIPAGYKHLQIRVSSCSDRPTYGGIDVATTFNSDTTASYSNHTTSTDGSGGVSSYETGRTTNMWLFDTGSTVLTAFNAAVIDILDYTETKYKTVRSLAGLDINGTIAGYGGSVGLWSGNWRKTEAITSITFVPGGSRSFVAGSQFSLYGIK